MGRKSKIENLEMHEELKGIFMDILKGPEERAAAFGKLRAMEAGNDETNIIQLPVKEKKREAVEMATPEKRKKKRGSAASGLKKILALYREYEYEVNTLLSVGGSMATVLVAYLTGRKPRRSRKTTK